MTAPAELRSARALEDARRELLDLTTRNRLLDTPRRKTRSRSIEVLDERSGQILKILVGDGKAMTFLPRPEATPDPDAPEGEAAPEPDVLFDADLLQPEEDESGIAAAGDGEEEGAEEPIPARHTDRRLQTGMLSEALQRRLLRLYHDARTVEEEQGVNVLYLALGFLRWFEDDATDRARHAPLILVPVRLERPSARSRFRVTWSGEDITTNLSLQVKLSAEYGVALPDVPHDTEDLDVGAYFDAVRAAIAPLARWSVLPDDIVLGFFSFARLLMYRDLDPASWPDEASLLDQPIVNALLGAGFPDEPPLCGENENIDHLLPARETLHVLDADSSQSLAIEEVRRGRNLVIHGPPGTGKSQTIANLIAAAVADGKRVLFVAEKLAALQVVKRRLERTGLGDMCLELHSNKARKRQVIEELGRTLELTRPVLDEIESTAAALEDTRARLNDHAAMMHESDEPSGLTPFRVIGEQVRLRARGVPPADFDLDDAESWTPADVNTRAAALRELAAYAGRIGTPAKHPWRGVGLEASLPADRRRLGQRLPQLSTTLGDAVRRTTELAAVLGSGAAPTAADASGLVDFARRMAAAPDPDPDALADEAWDRHRAEITDLVDAVRAAADARAALDGTVSEAAWSADVAEARRDLAAHGRSLLRFLNGAYRGATATLRGICVAEPPKDLDARLDILDTLLAGRRARDIVDSGDDLGARVFGLDWRGAASDHATLAEIDRWVTSCVEDDAVPADFRVRYASLPDADAMREQADAVADVIATACTGLRELFASLRLDTNIAFGRTSVEHVPLEEARHRVETWRANLDAQSSWIAYRVRDEAARGLGLGVICDRLFDGRVGPDAAESHFASAYHETIMRRLVKRRPELGAFDGLSHEAVLDRFRKLDETRIELARAEVAHRHYEGIPRGGAGIGEVGVIKREVAKRRRHLPIRQLLRRAGEAVTAIKPVFMMSPLSIAQYVEPGALEFDLLLIDEASQVRPVDALGAAARARQIVVVGDERQLPPTRFFMRTLDDLEVDDETVEQLGDLESILGLCLARNMPGRMLRWHYRSRHDSLIAVSNREFYDGRLHVIPSPVRHRDPLGLVYRRVEGGTYDRGGTATNRVEAAAVADAVMEHARRSPEQSLGVGAFSVGQRDAILDELERRRRAASTEIEAFFDPDRVEPFFVKNLENIQGDERDIILVSVGFAPDGDGRMAMHFGPVSNEGGQRRLNVLMTRARVRCELFASISDDDIDLDRTTGWGPRALRTFLCYARTGRLDASPPGVDGATTSFETEVARALVACGWECDPQVDAARSFIDIAVKDRQRPGRYVLGIECDGASYHGSRSARDRDRIRRQVLEDRGWAIHRIWSTDWFHRPEDELRRVISALEHADDPGGGSGGARSDVVVVRRETESDPDAGEPLDERFAEPYVEASFRVPARREVHEVPPHKMAGIVARIVDTEGPIHGDEVAQRVSDLWKLQRTGSRIQRAAQAALDLAVARELVRRDGPFYLRAEERPLRVRSRARVRSATLRKPAMLPPAEIRHCLRILLDHHLGSARDELVVAAARVLGYRTTSAQLRGVIERQIDVLAEADDIVEEGGRLRVAE